MNNFFKITFAPVPPAHWWAPLIDQLTRFFNVGWNATTSDFRTSDTALICQVELPGGTEREKVVERLIRFLAVAGYAVAISDNEADAPTTVSSANPLSCMNALSV